MKQSDHQFEFEWPGKVRLVARGWPALIACAAIVISGLAVAARFW
jgi:hypothetical protein